MRIAYLCNKQKSCKNSPGCYRPGTDKTITCNHTLDPRFALNGPCDDPEHSDRFECFGDFWQEKEIESEG